MRASKFGAHAGAAKKRARVHRGSTLSFRLSEDAKVVVTVTHTVKGLKRGSGRTRTCAVDSASLRAKVLKGVKKAERAARLRRLRCTATKRDGVVPVTAAHAGANRVAFTGRIGRKALKPGRYAASLQAIDAAGNRSQTVRVRFTIVSGRG